MMDLTGDPSPIVDAAHRATAAPTAVTIAIVFLLAIATAIAVNLWLDARPR